MYSNKKEYDLNCKEIACLLNQNSKVQKTESAWRKYYRNFKAGIDYANNNSDETTRILSISDLHIPYQLPIDTLSNYVNKVDILQINGDVCDCQSISRFPKVYRISPMEEIIQARQYIIDLIEYINPKKIIVNFGNHDIRFQNYLSKNLDNDIIELMPKTSLELILLDGFNHYNKREKTKVEYQPLNKVLNMEIEYTDNWHCQIGDTIFCHPSSFSNGILKTAERAMLYFRNEGYSFKEIVMAHTHRIGEYYIGNTRIMEQGCFCDVAQNNYSDGKLCNSQKEGFVYLCQDSNGNTLRDKTKLQVLN